MNRNEGGRHAGALDRGRSGLMDPLIGGAEGAQEQLSPARLPRAVLGPFVANDGRERLDGDATRDFPRPMTTDSIGESKEP
jgi:hypothetical protein